MENKVYDNIIDWIEKVSKSIEKSKVTVYLNGEIDGYLASKLACKIFGKENVLNVIIPCYSSEDYIVESTSFSKDNEIMFNIIGIKHIYDSIMEKDIDDDNDELEENFKIEILNYIRNSIIESTAIKNKSMIFNFKKISYDLYQFQIIFKNKYIGFDNLNYSQFLEDRDLEKFYKILQ